MNVFKRAALLTLTMTLAGANAQAPQTPAPAATPAAAQGTIRNPFFGILSGGGAGAYNFFQYDRTEIEKLYLGQVFKQRDKDYEYFLKSVADIEGEFKTLIDSIFEKDTGLKALSDQSVFGNQKPVPATDFLAAINRFNTQKQVLETRIQTLTAISEGMVPSSMELDAKGERIGTVPQYGKTAFDPIKNFYKERVAATELFAQNLPYSVQMPNGIPYIIAANSGKGLVLEAPALRMSIDDLIKLREEVVKLQRWSYKAKDTIDAYTIFLRSRINKFVENYGTEERFRRLDQAAKDQRAAEAKAIADTFWSRSYLRATYGMPVGAIGSVYQRQWAHLDAYMATTESLMNLVELPVWGEDQLDKIETAYRLNLKRSDIRAEKILDGNLGLLATGENLLVFLGGKRNFAAAAGMMLRTLAADLFEERLIQKGGGSQEMVARYRARYGSNDADTAYYSKLAMAYDPDMNDPQDYRRKYADRPEMIKAIFGEDEDAAFLDVGATGQNERSLKGQLSNVLVYMDTKQTELALAAEKKLAIANAENPNNKFRLNVKARASGLLK